MQYEPAALDGNLFEHQLGQRLLQIVRVEPVYRKLFQIARKNLIGQFVREGLVLPRHLLEIQPADAGVHQIKLALVRLVVHICVKSHHSAIRPTERRDNLQLGAQTDARRIGIEQYLRRA